MKFNEFKDLVSTAYNKYFPGSMCDVSYFNCLGSAIYVDCFMGANEKEMLYGYRNNDMMKVQYAIDMPEKHTINDDLPANMVLRVISKHYAVKPANDYYAFDTHQMNFRQVKGEADKLAKQLEKNFSSLHEAIAADVAAGNLRARDAEIAMRHLT